MTSRDMVQVVGTYIIAVLVLCGAFVLIYTADPAKDTGQAWLAVGAVLGYVFRDAGGNAGARNAATVATATGNAVANGVPGATGVPPSP